MIFFALIVNVSCFEGDENIVLPKLNIPFKGNYSLYLGLGTLYQFGISHQTGNNYYALRHHAFINPIAAIGYGVEDYNLEYALLIGKATKLGFKNASYIALSTGISYFFQGRPGEQLGYENYEQLYYEGVGIPIDLSITKGFLRIFGFSLNVSININKENLFGGIFFNTHLGDFRNPEYVKKFSNPRTRDPQKNMLDKNLESSDNYKDNKIYNNFSLQLNPLRYLLNVREQTLHLNGQLSKINFYKNNDLIIDVKYEEDYRHSDFYDIYAYNKSFFKLDMNLRKWLGSGESFYVNYGFRYINMINFNDESMNFTMLSGAFGYYYQLSNRIFANNFLSFAVPMNNLENFEQNFQGFGMNSSRFMMTLSIFNIGINF